MVCASATGVVGSGAEDSSPITVTLTGTDVDGTVASYTLSTLPAAEQRRQRRAGAWQAAAERAGREPGRLQPLRRLRGSGCEPRPE